MPNNKAEACASRKADSAAYKDAMELVLKSFIWPKHFVLDSYVVLFVNRSA